jgi:hypothetical protein
VEVDNLLEKCRAVLLCVLSFSLIAIKRERCGGELFGRIDDLAIPGQVFVHAFGPYDRRNGWRCAQHGVEQLSLDASSKSQGREAKSRGGHNSMPVVGTAPY